MPYKRKDNGVYYSNFESRSGERVRKSLRTRDRNEAIIKEAELIAADKGEVVQINNNRKTWRDAVYRYWNEVEGKASADCIQIHLRFLDTFLGDKYLDEINDELIEDIIAAKSSEKNRKGEKLSGATVNRLTATLKSVFNSAKKYRWIDNVPYVRKLEESEGRSRYLTPSESKRLLDHCAEHLKPIVTFALHTGLRKQNVLRLRWENVDLDQGKCWVLSSEHKNRKARGVTLNSVALGVLRELAIYKVSPYVFNYRGRPIGDVKTGLKRACERAGLKDISFHTFRHTYASLLAQQNVSTLVLKELGGWKSMQMAQRYAHLNDDGLREYQELLVGLSQYCDKNPPPKLRLVSGKS